MPKPTSNIPVTVGDQLEVEVETLNSSGDGIARVDGFTVFVPQGLPGDQCKIEITKTANRYSVARVIERTAPGPHRIDSPCPVFPECGGCRLQDLNYEQQLYFKAGVVKDNLKHIGKIDWPEPIKAIPAIPVYGYRNKGSFALEGRGKNLGIGFFKTGTHEVVDSATCDTLMEPVNAVKEWLRSLISYHHVSIYDETKHMGFLRNLVIRHSPTTGQSLVGLVTTRGIFKKRFLPDLTKESDLKRLGIVGILQNFNAQKSNFILGSKSKPLWGREYLEDNLVGLKFKISLGSFFQVNPNESIKLYKLIEEWTHLEKGLIVDAYCGNGGIALWLARAGRKVLGIDEFAPAIEDAKTSAGWNKLNEVQFEAGTLESHLEGLKEKNIGTLIVDPPRKGLSTHVVETIPKLNPPRLIYVSCNPATLARDLALLTDYSIKDIRVIDMFPQTPHIETAVLLEKV
ncbi:MAG: 23S rRNA (uracil(1939)-C(5))-methyltransferase RlmD [Candidatus Nitronauta litoralis]|uniref:23S rRNA (Uracil(1939)-C(5))-methyltransferase RlmD n=1 Tax=Candidatus Nitronauta litoralis TaxID=2705533 RepID=A0A7T0BUC6_9BACT|nr:MAG: 23S rRNA (uracil(1939)-C(5))-methyltransferase RlmD [Candidatus Nitronauta litoralis]